MNLCSIKYIKNLLEKYNCNFSKTLGQNFLINNFICQRIVEMSGISKDIGVIEIGPGVGALTVEIADKAKKVVSIEIDKKLIPILNETLSDFNNIKVINDDVLKVDLNKLIKEEFGNMDVIVCANLPYYITSPIIMYLLESKLKIKSITVMVQKEAANRIVALPGTRDVGALSLAVRYYSEPSILFDVSSKNFIPSPDVESSVVKFDIRKSPIVNVKSEKLFFSVIKALFAQRRKTVANSLANNLNLEKHKVLSLLEKLQINEKLRAENLSLINIKDISDEIFFILSK